MNKGIIWTLKMDMEDGFELASSNARVTPIESTKQEFVSQ